ncbi:MAG: 6-carboxytetrahydropterin synthase QueD [Candidatus Omnitrophica bacterium]|nr:6-carboxytetrahydropterin synthase QueD [Candidatus Omnitrophota bacterium]
MYEVRVILEFSAAHMLRDYKGKCENLHGHNWKVEVTAFSTELNKQGMVVDFAKLKKNLKGVLDKLDHRNLNEITYFRKVNPTSENIARYIYNRLIGQVPGIREIKVWESDTACATYEE